MAGVVTADMLSTSSKIALFTAMALLAKSSSSWMLVCLLRLPGVSKLLLFPSCTIHGWLRTVLASGLMAASLAKSFWMR